MEGEGRGLGVCENEAQHIMRTHFGQQRHIQNIIQHRLYNIKSKIYRSDLMILGNSKQHKSYLFHGKEEQEFNLQTKFQSTKVIAKERKKLTQPPQPIKQQEENFEW